MSKTVLPSGPQGTNRMQVEKHDGSRWNKTNTQEIKISLYSPARPTTTTGQTPRCCHADRVTPARAAPPRTCGARAAGTGNTPPALCDVGGRCLALGVCFCTGRWFPFFITKNSQVGFFNNTPIFFSFFVGFGSSRGAWAGIGCVWAHPLFRSREICVSAVILSVNSLLCTVQDQSASAASETGEGEGEKLNQVGQVLSAPEPPSSALSLSLSLSLTHH